MIRLLSLSALPFLLGCWQGEVTPLVLVAESVPISEADVEAQSLPRYIPEGTQYGVPAVGFEASDGSFYPVLALARPVPRGGSVSPVQINGRLLKVYRGVDPIAARNELIGVFEIAGVTDGMQIGFSINSSSQLHLSVSDAASGENLAVRGYGSKHAISGLDAVASASLESTVSGL